MDRWRIGLLVFIGVCNLIVALSPWNLPRPEPPGRGLLPWTVVIVAAVCLLRELLRKNPDA